MKVQNQNTKPINIKYAAYKQNSSYKPQKTMTCDIFQSSKPSFGTNIKEVTGIPNLFRSPCPKIEDFQHLKEKNGIDVLVDLLGEDRQKRTQKAKELGMDYICEDGAKLFGFPPSKQKILSLVDDILQKTQEGKKVLIYCKKGQSRTGNLVAVCQDKKEIAVKDILQHAKECGSDEYSISALIKYLKIV